MPLRIEHLSKTYPNGTRALNDVSLEIPQGMFGLLGPNGAGKSTLMRILATLQEADAGAAHLDDIDVLTEKERVRRTLGYLPQEFGVYPKVTAEELLDHFGVLKGIVEAKQRREIVRALLEQTNLYEVRQQKLGSFSGGMRQRFGIAVALLGNPKLIIVDEPTAGLDPAERVRFLNLLSALGESAVVILYPHIVDDVSELCSHMAIIDRGEIRLTGEPQHAISTLQGKIWRRLIERGELASYQARQAVISTRSLASGVVIRVLSDDVPGPGFALAETNLEDVYFAALRGTLAQPEQALAATAPDVIGGAA